jgi:hypothetical protein
MSLNRKPLLCTSFNNIRKFNTQTNIPKSFNSNRIENLLCKKFSTLEKKSELQKYVTYEDLQKQEIEIKKIRDYFQKQEKYIETKKLDDENLGKITLLISCVTFLFCICISNSKF